MEGVLVSGQSGTKNGRAGVWGFGVRAHIGSGFYGSAKPENRGQTSDKRSGHRRTKFTPFT